MERVLQVVAVIDAAAPSAWVVQVLHDVQQHAKMQLTVALDDSPEQLCAVSSRPAARLAHWLLHKVVDTPHFSHDPWAATAIPAHINVLPIDKSSAAVEQCDVIINLARAHPKQSLLPKQTPVWSAALPLLDQAIQHALMKREPFIWLHLWQPAFNADGKVYVGTRIASHALPCQTYSVSDLRRLSYSALPSLFMSRLNWLANSDHFTLDDIDTQIEKQGVFAHDAQLALNDAEFLLSIEHDSSNEFDSLTTPLVQTTKLLVKKTIERIHHKLFTERWQMAIHKSTSHQSHSLADIANVPIQDFKSVATTDDVMWADPHLIEHSEGKFVFFERMHTHGKPAHIAYAKLDNDGQIIDLGTALSADHHLSFPFVFTHANHYYMIPETASLNKVCLYKANTFPNQWQLECTLLDNINAADTVLFQHQNLWWMFTCCQSHRSVDERDELHLYYANQPTGPWQAHALNPVITGVDRSRMAGPIVEEDGKLLRSSQYGAWRYGYGLNISRIDELTPTTYRESAISRMEPTKTSEWVACHSICKLGDLSVIDRARHSRR